MSIKPMKKKKTFDHKIWLVNTSKIITSNFSTYNTIGMDFKIKRNLFGELIKHKDCSCVHDGMQLEGLYFHNKFAPVTNFSTVRLIIMMAKMAGQESRKIDYVIALSRAPIDSDVYLHLPSGFHVDGEN